MKVRFNINSGANIHSRKSRVVDTVKDLGYDEGEWEQLTNEEKDEAVMQWAWNNGLSVWWEEITE